MPSKVESYRQISGDKLRQIALKTIVWAISAQPLETPLLGIGRDFRATSRRVPHQSRTLILAKVIAGLKAGSGIRNVDFSHSSTLETSN
jgi:hypothetical protein